jgi:hypothetical protein
MKQFYTFLTAIAISTAASAQGTITGFTVSPAAPTTMDNVYMYVDVQFSSGGCAVANQGHTTSGSVTNASALHCVGMLSMICNEVDTFNLGMLPAGAHVFNMTLSSGMGGPPCSPGFAPDDSRNSTFTVTTATGISHLQNDPDVISLFPNPVSTTAVIKITDRIRLENAELKIMDVTGRVIQTVSSISNNEIPLDREQLSAGVYFYELTEAGESVKGKFVVQ